MLPNIKCQSEFFFSYNSSYFFFFSLPLTPISRSIILTDSQLRSVRHFLMNSLASEKGIEKEFKKQKEKEKHFPFFSLPLIIWRIGLTVISVPTFIERSAKLQSRSISRRSFTFSPYYRLFHNFLLIVPTKAV